MSINPVQGIGPAAEARMAEADQRPRPSPASAAESVQPHSGTAPKQERHIHESAPASFEMPQDEVQVQRDGEGNGEIVIRYMDHSGNLILQIPSPQVLSMARAIDQDFHELEKARTNASSTPASNEGGKSHGH